MSSITQSNKIRKTATPLNTVESEELKKTRELEVEAVCVAESGSLGDALELLALAVTLAPD